MNNLIMNSALCPGANGCPECFSLYGPITYDNFALSGNRTCSVSMRNSGMSAGCRYNTPISVCNQNAITFGCYIRCIEANCITLCCDFYDGNNCLIQPCRKNITCDVGVDFSNQAATFNVPRGASCCRVAIQCDNCCTACTFCAPYAYYS